MADADVRVTVAVVTRDQADLLDGCLSAVTAQSVTDIEVVVVDNGSVDDTARVVERHAGLAVVPVRYVRHEGPLGGARQRAVDEARGEFIAFTDTDCRPDRGWIAGALSAFDAPEVDVVQGRTVPAGPTYPGCATQHIERFTDLYETCNIVYRTSRLRTAGGFDPTWEFFGEDTVAGWRVRRLGGRGRFADAALVVHEVLPGGLRWQLRRAAGYGAYNALVRQFPEMRDELLWHRWFLRRRSAEFDAALVGAAVALTSRRPRGLLAGAALSASILRRHRPSVTGSRVATARRLLVDATVLAALVRGSIRERTVVL